MKKISLSLSSYIFLISGILRLAVKKIISFFYFILHFILYPELSSEISSIFFLPPLFFAGCFLKSSSEVLLLFFKSSNFCQQEIVTILFLSYFSCCCFLVRQKKKIWFALTNNEWKFHYSSRKKSFNSIRFVPTNIWQMDRFSIEVAQYFCHFNITLM